MSRPIRYQPEEWSVSFVTGRCIHSRYLLRPSPRTNAIVIGALARALHRYEVKLFGVCFMSNHYHLLLSSKNAAALASFMQYIGSNIARKIGRMHRWREKFWSRRYRASAVLDDAAQQDRMRYILSNSVKEGLVKHPRYWPGVHCYRHLVERTPLSGIWIDRTALSRNPKAPESEFTTRYQVQLDTLPCFDDLSDIEYRQTIRELADEAVAGCDDVLKFIGQKKILAQEPLASPEQTNRSPAPLCHSGCSQLKREFVCAFREFVTAYKQAYQRVMTSGLALEFPPGSLPPTAWSRSLTPT